MNNIKRIFCFFIVYLFFMSNIMAQDIRFVQISDVRYSNDNKEVLAETIKDVNKLENVDFVVFTGDNIKSPNVEYLKGFIKTAKKLNKPFYVVIGDRDVNKRKDLGKKEYVKILRQKRINNKAKDTNFVFEKKGVMFYVVDGSRDVVPGTNGYFKGDTVDWLNYNLDLHPDNNAIILQHFPIIPPENKESYITLKPENYLAVLHRHKNIKAVISGHFGINKEEIIDGISHITTAPAPNYRIIDVLDCTSTNPTIWAEIREAKLEDK